MFTSLRISDGYHTGRWIWLYSIDKSNWFLVWAWKHGSQNTFQISDDASKTAFTHWITWTFWEVNFILYPMYLKTTSMYHLVNRTLYAQALHPHYAKEK